MPNMDRHTTAPFMLRLFYRTGAFHRPDEFNVGAHTDNLPRHLTLHVWPDCTLTELAHHIAAHSASLAASSSSSLSSSTSAAGRERRPSSSEINLLPNPAIGTRLVFRLIFADFRAAGAANGGGPPSNGGPAAAAVAGKFSVKDLGSVVIGEGGRGLDVSDLDLDEDNLEDQEVGTAKLPPPEVGGSEGFKTLSEARLVAGDYISCAILPPLEDGSVAPASAARTGRGYGAGEARALGSTVVRPSRGTRGPGAGTGAGRRDFRGEAERGGRYRAWDGGRHGRGDGYGERPRDGRRGARAGDDRGGGGVYGDAGDGGGRRYRDRGDGDRGVPTGEWRRGEALPTVPKGDWPRGEDLHGHDVQPSGGRNGRTW